jgi:hypothetical protein
MIYQLFTRSYHPWSSTERRKKKSLALLILAELLYNLRHPSGSSEFGAVKCRQVPAGKFRGPRSSLGDGLQERADLGVASCRAADVVQLPRMVRSMVLGAAHEPIPATVPVGSVRWEKLRKQNTSAVKILQMNIKEMRQCCSASRCL